MRIRHGSGEPPTHALAVPLAQITIIPRVRPHRDCSPWAQRITLLIMINVSPGNNPGEPAARSQCTRLRLTFGFSIRSNCLVVKGSLDDRDLCDDP
jgi:hypothetical protein